MVRIVMARRLREERVLAPPPLSEVVKITAILADDKTFAALSEDGKNALRLALYNIRIQLQAHYHDLILAEKESAATLLAVLKPVPGALEDHHNLLTRVAEELRVSLGWAVGDSWRAIRSLADLGEVLVEALERIKADPHGIDMRTVGRLKRQHEVLMIRDCLRVVGVEILLTDAGDHGGTANPGLALAARIVRYTSGRKVGARAFRILLSRAQSATFNT
jgi:hypothetical protein